jgi:hypothetical protein
MNKAEILKSRKHPALREEPQLRRFRISPLHRAAAGRQLCRGAEAWAKAAAFFPPCGTNFCFSFFCFSRYDR